jgi:hypothetical protein
VIVAGETGSPSRAGREARRRGSQNFKGFAPIAWDRKDVSECQILLKEAVPMFRRIARLLCTANSTNVYRGDSDISRGGRINPETIRPDRREFALIDSAVHLTGTHVFREASRPFPSTGD